MGKEPIYTVGKSKLQKPRPEKEGDSGKVTVDIPPIKPPYSQE
jgi:hypothetical protein